MGTIKKATPKDVLTEINTTPEGLVRLAMEALRLEERERAAHMARVFGASERLIAALRRGRI